MRHLCLALLAVLSVARPAAADLPVFTDADAAASVAADPVDPSWTYKLTPLYGGSDRSAFQVDLVQGNTQSPDPPLLTLLDVPFPTDLRPGDALTGRVWVATNSNEPESVVVSTVTGADAPAYAGEVTPPLYRTNWSLPAIPPFRLPIDFDPAHRPSRLRLRLVPRPGSGFCQVVAIGLRLVHADDPLRPPTTRPTADPSPAWPPAGLAGTVVRAFSGNDFDGHLVASVSSDDHNPVVLQSIGANGLVIGVQYDPAAGPLRTVPVLSVDDPASPPPGTPSRGRSRTAATPCPAATTPTS